MTMPKGVDEITGEKEIGCFNLFSEENVEIVNNTDCNMGGSINQEWQRDIETKNLELLLNITNVLFCIEMCILMME